MTTERIGMSAGKRILLSTFLLLFLHAIPAVAQLPTGTILGVVRDSSGAVIAGATVTATNTDTGFIRNVMSEADGSYRFDALPVGNYGIKVTHEGFQTEQRSGLTLLIAQFATVNIILQVGSTSQTVTVTEAVPLVDTTSSSVGGTVDEQRVTDLPLNGRNWTDLTLMQAGVTKVNIFTVTSSAVAVSAGFNGTIYSSNGATARSNMYTLDGADERTENGYNNTSITNTALGVDGIKEYKVVSVLPDASYPLVMGSQTTIVSKGGTNQFHGDVYDYLRNASLDARNYFDALDTANANGFGTDKSLTYPGKRIPPFRRNDFGAAFGGPIKKDKTFFFGAFEGIREGTGITITKTTLPAACFVNGVVPALITNSGCVSTASAAKPIAVNPYILPLANLFPQPNVVGYPTFNYTFPFIQPTSENYEQFRVDQDLSASDSVFVRYTQDVASQTSNNSFMQFNLALHSAAQLGTISETHVFSPSLLNTFSFSFSRSVTSTTNAAEPASVTNAALLALPSSGTFESLSPGGGVSGTGADVSVTPGSVQDLFSWYDDVFWTKGKHAFKFGALLNYYQDFADTAFDTMAGLSFGSLANFFNADYSGISVAPPTANFARQFHSNTYGFYAQDDYRVTNRLTLNLGLRYEFSSVPSEVNPAIAYAWRYPGKDTVPTPGPLFLNPSLHAFSPRIGFAWDPFGKGETSIRGGAGIYYDVGNYGVLYQNNSIATPPISATVTINNTAAVPAIPLSIPLSGAIADAISTAPPSLRSNPFNLGQPGLWQRSLTIEQQLPWSMGLSVSYVGSQGWDIYTTREGNQTVAVGRDSRGLPIYGCWNTADTAYQLPLASGSCPSGFANFGPRTNPVLGQDKYNQTNGNTYFNSLQVSLNKRITQGLQFQFNYTWSKLLDDGQGVASTESTENSWLVPDGYNTKFDRGPALFDSPNNLRVNLIYRAPTIQSSGLVSKLTNGWWFSSIVSAQSGYPFTPSLGVDRALQNDTEEVERPNLDPSFNKATAVKGNVTQWFNPTMFDVPVSGTLGNSGRDILRGPGFTNVDFSIVKDTKVAFLGEAGNVEFRAEFFNLMNHPNFALPVATVWSGTGGATTAPAGQIGTAADLAFATAGQISSTVATSRQVQFALKILF